MKAESHQVKMVAHVKVGGHFTFVANLQKADYIYEVACPMWLADLQSRLMKLKQYFLASILLLAINTLNAQTEQGVKMVGGMLDLDLAFDDDDDAFVFALTPQLGIFVVDRIALGGDLGIEYFKRGDDNSTTSFSLGPFARLYVLGGGDLQMFIDARMSYLLNRSKVVDVSDTQHGFQFLGGPGLSYFLADNLALDFTLAYNYRTFGEDANSSNLKLLAGFQIFL
ncbi:MAG: outer membrane beta-barrel protein [Saprospiraceae bacterium]|nr:outer membrane beta-barrel protein [Saprospiraceae bacterium]